MRSDLLRVRYFLHCLFHRNGYEHAQFLKKHDAFHAMGENCFFQPYNLPADAKYIRLGDNVVVASNVSFICHDVIHNMLNHAPDSSGEYSTYWGTVEVKDNVFIGSNTTVLTNVTIGSNVVIAAGSLVNKDVPDGKIVGGVPAKVIGAVSDLAEARKQYSESPLAALERDERLDYLWREKK